MIPEAKWNYPGIKISYPGSNPEAESIHDWLGALIQNIFYIFQNIFYTFQNVFYRIYISQNIFYSNRITFRPPCGK